MNNDGIMLEFRLCVFFGHYGDSSYLLNYYSSL